MSNRYGNGRRETETERQTETIETHSIEGTGRVMLSSDADPDAWIAADADALREVTQ